MIPLRELDLAGVFLSPMVAYLLATAVFIGMMRLILRYSGAYRWIWHPALFDVSLFVIVLTTLVVSKI